MNPVSIRAELRRRVLPVYRIVSVSSQNACLAMARRLGRDASPDRLRTGNVSGVRSG